MGPAGAVLPRKEATKLNGWTKTIIGWLLGALMALGGAWASVSGRIHTTATVAQVEEIVAKQAPWTRDKAAVEGRISRTESDVRDLAVAIRTFADQQAVIAAQVAAMNGKIDTLVSRRRP